MDIPCPKFNWEADDQLSESRRFKRKCENYFKGPLHKAESLQKRAYASLWIDNETFDNISESWPASIKDEDPLEHFWHHYDIYFKPNINKYIYRQLLAQVLQHKHENVDTFVCRVTKHVKICKYTTKN